VEIKKPEVIEVELKTVENETLERKRALP